MKNIDLSGKWSFMLDPKGDIDSMPRGMADTISLPGTTAMAGKGEYNTKSETGFLTENYPYEGLAWYSKRIKLEADDPGQIIKLYLERTRLTAVYIDGIKVPAEYAKNEDSLCAPHIYDLTEMIGSPEFDLTICVKNCGYKTKGGHMTSPDTQTNWNGITGRISLMLLGTDDLKDIQVKTLDDKGNISLSMKWDTLGDLGESLPLLFKYYECRLEGSSLVERPFVPVLADASKKTVVIGGDNKGVTLSLPLGKEAIYWDEYSPVFYHLYITGLDEDVYGDVYFGLRILSRDEKRLYVNGRPVFLRGKHDGCVFPLTGACPTDLASWLKVMGTAKEYGINHYRYHTSCPPEAAFLAADLLGIYVEPELPFWGTISAPGEEGYNEEEQEYLIKEGIRIQKAFGNHPSFCFMSLGNELWGSSSRMGEIIRRLKAKDDRHLFVQGSNNFQFMPCILPEDDIFVGVRFGAGRLIRGSYAMCDAPQGFVQTDAPNTTHDYDKEFENFAPQENSDDEVEIQYGTGVKKVKAEDAGGFKLTRPVISHEIGQYATFPDFKEINKYTGVLRADNFKIFRERMEDAGLLDLAPDYFYCSGKLAVQCYRNELEAAHRSRYLSGYQILDLQDFPGQGTSLVGVLDAFMDNKGLISAKEWKRFCSDMVVLASFDSFMLKSGGTLDAKILISCYRPDAVGTGKSVTVTWRLYERSSQTIDYDEVAEVLRESGSFATDINDYGVTEVGSIKAAVPEVSLPLFWRLEIEVPAFKVKNDYIFELLPDIGNEELDLLKNEIFVSSDPEAVLDNAKKGRRCVLFSDKCENFIKGTYCTEFWNYPMFKSISEWMKKPLPIGTYGLLIDPDHPALSMFPSLQFSTPQWYRIVTDAHLNILDEVKEVRPIVRMMDNFERNHSLGLLWECKVYDSPVLVCAQSEDVLLSSIEGRSLLKSLYCYASSDEFAPAAGLSSADLLKTLKMNLHHI